MEKIISHTTTGKDMTTNDIRKQVEKRKREYDLLKKTLEEVKIDFKKEKVRYIRSVKARDFIQEVAKSIQEKVHTQIAEVVTRGLRTVFDDPYTFKIIFEKKRGKTEARLVFEKDGKEIDPISASAGGAVDVASFCLRVACIMLSHNEVKPVLILDEPFKNISEKYLPEIPTLLEYLRKKLKIQIIMITHIEELRMGKVIIIQQKRRKHENNQPDDMERHGLQDQDGKSSHRTGTKLEKTRGGGERGVQMQEQVKKNLHKRPVHESDLLQTKKKRSS